MRVKDGSLQTVLGDACLGMKFDPVLKLFVIEVRGVSQLKTTSAVQSSSQPHQRTLKAQKFQFIISYRQSLKSGGIKNNNAFSDPDANQKSNNKAKDYHSGSSESLTWFDAF